MPFNPAFAESDVPVDPGAGITPAYIEACLPTDSAGCHLSCMGAYNALMAFFKPSINTLSTVRFWLL